jgi:nucleotidyltransferase AbiEii toxin of type IV toxin-antitoxin system
VEFDAAALSIESIRAEDEYADTRVHLPARCGKARLPLQIDMGLGDRNSWIKDFFDLHELATHFEFDRATLAEAIRRTFARRHTPIPTDEPIGLTAAYWENPSRGPQVRAFVRRAGLKVSSNPGAEILSVTRSFLLPILNDLHHAAAPSGTWRPGGPWRAREEAAP